MRKLQTFIVEDSPVILQGLIDMLEELAPVMVVGTADDELTALEWLCRPSPQVDLVILDLFLKSGSGLGVLRGLNPQAQPYKLVVLSNYVTKDIQRKCLELGAHEVFDKSNDIDALISYCHELAMGQGDAKDHDHAS